MSDDKMKALNKYGAVTLEDGWRKVLLPSLDMRKKDRPNKHVVPPLSLHDQTMLNDII